MSFHLDCFGTCSSVCQLVINAALLTGIITLLECLEAEGGTGQEGAQKPTSDKWS